MSRTFTIVLAALALAALAVGCTETVIVVVTPDASVPDAPSLPPGLEHCEVTGDAYEDLGSPLDAVGLLPSLTEPVAIGDGVVAVAFLNAVYTNESGAFERLPVEGLAADVRIGALGFHDGTWWVGTDPRPGPTVYRYDESARRWEPRGRPTEEAVVQLISYGTRLLLHTQFDVAVLDDPSGSLYRVLPRAEDDFVTDLLATDRGVYVSMRSLDSRVLFSSDTLTFEEVPTEEPLMGDDLMGAGGTVIVSAGIGFSESYFILDESEPVPTLRRRAVVGGLVPSYLGHDGTVIARIGNDPYFGRRLDGPFVPAGDSRPSFTTTGIALIWHVASDATSIVVPTAVTGGTLVLRSFDHGATFGPAAEVEVPATALELSSDGTTPILRVRGDRGEWRVFALREGDAWEEVSIPHGSFAGITGLPGAFLSRTTEYGDTPPQLSTDGGRTWTALDFYFPSYYTNAGEGLRVVTDFARDEEGRFLAATEGGTTSICCTGSKIGWGYRPGAGVWRWTDRWTPVNAGIPVEAGPDPLGGPPFRSDIDAIVASPLGVFAMLRGRGVYRMRADRWAPSGDGLPLDASYRLFAVRDASGRPRVGAVSSTSIHVEDEGLWLPIDTEGTVAAVATRADLMVVAGSAGLSVSSDAGETLTALPPLPAVAGVPRLATLTRERLYVAGEDHRVRALSIRCSGGE